MKSIIAVALFGLAQAAVQEETIELKGRIDATQVGRPVVQSGGSFVKLDVRHHKFFPTFVLCPRITKTGEWLSTRLYAGYELQSALNGESALDIKETSREYFVQRPTDRACKADLPVYAVGMGKERDLTYYVQYDKATKTVEWCDNTHYYEAPVRRSDGHEFLCHSYNLGPPEYRPNTGTPKKKPMVRSATMVKLDITKVTDLPDLLACDLDGGYPLSIPTASIRQAINDGGHKVDRKVKLNWGREHDDPSLPLFVGYIGRKPEAAVLFSYDAHKRTAHFLGAVANGSPEPVVDGPSDCSELLAGSWNTTWTV